MLVELDELDSLCKLRLDELLLADVRLSLKLLVSVEKLEELSLDVRLDSDSDDVDILDALADDVDDD